MITNIKQGEDCNIHKDSYLGYKEHGGLISLGNSVTVLHGCVIRSCTGSIVIGDRVSIGYHCVLHGLGGITIGDDVMISPNVHIYAQNHGMNKDARMRAQKNTSKGITIGDDVWIGASSVICDGVHIARGCVIGAGSVLTKSTSPYEVWGGNPAVKLKERK